LTNGRARSLYTGASSSASFERHAAFVVLLQNQVATRKRVLLIDKVDHLFAIGFNHDVIALCEDVLVEPKLSGLVARQYLFKVDRNRLGDPLIK
jgi:hypothetical protein